MVKPECFYARFGEEWEIGKIWWGTEYELSGVNWGTFSKACVFGFFPVCP